MLNMKQKKNSKTLDMERGDRMPICDSCGKTKSKTRRIELGGGSGITLCDPCLRKEIKWRKERNKKLSPSNRFRTKYKF